VHDRVYTLLPCDENKPPQNVTGFKPLASFLKGIFSKSTAPFFNILFFKTCWLINLFVSFVETSYLRQMCASLNHHKRKQSPVGWFLESLQQTKSYLRLTRLRKNNSLLVQTNFEDYTSKMQGIDSGAAGNHVGHLQTFYFEGVSKLFFYFKGVTFFLRSMTANKKCPNYNPDHWHC